MNVRTFVTNVIIITIATVVPAFGDVRLSVETIASGFSQPVFICSPSGDFERLFVVELKTGRVRIIKSGHVLPTPFLDIGNKVLGAGFEQGLFSLAFHPNYSKNGYFYVNYTAPGGGNAGHTVIERYTTSSNPDLADASSAFVILEINQPFVNHNGGMIAFSPADHYLYIGMGDGGSGNDPENRAQTLTDPLGKLLRIDVDSIAPYGIPPSNPYSMHPVNDKRIWSSGLRNPWRFSFDRSTGDLYIGDVGQNAREEIDFQSAGSSGNENYGWSISEGFSCLGGTGNCGTINGFTPPIYDYDRVHGQGVTGGYVYRGTAIPNLSGTYFFADSQSNNIWSLKYTGTISEFFDRTAELNPGHLSIGLVSFGEDAEGELYLTEYNGRIFKIIAAPPPANVSNIWSSVWLLAGLGVVGCHGMVRLRRAR